MIIRLTLAVVLLVGCSGGSGTGAAPASPSGSASTVNPAPSSPPHSPTASATKPASCVERTLAGLDRRAKVGQLFMVGVAITGADRETLAKLRRYRPGALILMGRTDAPLADVRAVVDQAAAAAGAPAGARPVVAVDQEGGLVRRLRSPDMPPMPSAAEQAELPDAELRRRARQWAAAMRAAGITLDLAPVADVVPADVGSTNEPVGALGRGYGFDPDRVARKVAAVVRGLSTGGVDSAVKHFPGLGRVRGNTDFSVGVIDRDTRRGDPLLAPFAAGVRAGAGWLMVSLATYPRIDDDRAVFSPIVLRGMVREDLGFAGVVVSDDMGVAAEVASVPPGERAMRFLAAGGDVVLTVDPAVLPEMYEAVLAMRLPDLEAKVRRVLAAKQRAGLLRCDG